MAYGRDYQEWAYVASVRLEIGGLRDDIDAAFGGNPPTRTAADYHPMMNVQDEIDAADIDMDCPPPLMLDFDKVSRAFGAV